MKPTAGAYHEKTCYERSEMGGHFLDWRNQPDVFKTYDGLESITLPREMPLPRADLFDLYGHGPEPPRESGLFDLETLSRILLLTYTLTSRAHQPGGMFYFRSAASAGALYPTEIYVVSEGMADVNPGLYHFSIAQHRLVKLRDGYFSGSVKDIIDDNLAGASPLTFFFTAIFFRSEWKYRDRSYRYHLLDTGHVLENLLLSLKALGYAFDITFDFDDTAVNGFLGLDDNLEVSLAVCRVKGLPEQDARHNPPMIEDLPETVKAASRVSTVESHSSAVRAVHYAGYERILSNKADFKMCSALGVATGAGVSVQSKSIAKATLAYPDAVFRRRSSRNFIAESMPISSFDRVLKVLSRTGSEENIPCFRSICIGFLTCGVESLPDGFYLMDEKGKGLDLVRPGAFTAPMSQICLDQDWMARASVHVVFMTNMKVLERVWGPRGYRYAMMTAGRLGERLYLAASALGLGCCGIGAFYDGEACDLLGLDAASRVVYVVSLGVVKAMVKRDGIAGCRQGHGEKRYGKGMNNVWKRNAFVFDLAGPYGEPCCFECTGRR